MNLSRAIVMLGIITLTSMVSCSARQVKNDNKSDTTLKDAFQGKFTIGTALTLNQIGERNKAADAVIKTHFNSIVAENNMKSMYLQPREGEFYFDDADRFVEFGERNNMQIIGHTLIWHSQAPSWFFKDENGNDVSRDVLIERMRNHIHTVVSRYKGRIHGWDVVNEAVLDNGKMRDSKFYQIIGEDFVRLAFQFAHEADPDVELYYNDYSTAVPAKRDGIVRMIKNVLDAGVKVDALGMQQHNGLDNPSIAEVEKTIEAFAKLGTKVMVTEMEISVLPHTRANQGAELTDVSEYRNELNPYVDGLPDDVMTALGKRYVDFFALYLKHHDKITRVTVWGVGDGNSWKNGWPIRGRTDYPLLFDRSYQAKPFVKDIIKLTQNAK